MGRSLSSAKRSRAGARSSLAADVAKPPGEVPCSPVPQCFAAAALAAFALLAPSGARNRPTRTVRMVVPFAPGGATDIIARIVAQKLADRLGQGVVVENKPGAGTTIGNAEVAKAKPDGYTFLFAPTPFVISQVVYPTLPYDPQKDFAPVSLLATSPFILVVNAAFRRSRPPSSSRSRRRSRARSRSPRRATAPSRTSRASSSSSARASTSCTCRTRAAARRSSTSCRDRCRGCSRRRSR
jgi:hypothetical protein